MPKIISKGLPEEPTVVRVTCGNCKTVADYDQEREIRCSSVDRGWWSIKWEETFHAKCPACLESIKLSSESVNSMRYDVVDQKKRESRRNYSLTYVACMG
jgi:hypothetical protein